MLEKHESHIRVSDASQNATVGAQRRQQADARHDRICGPYPAFAPFTSSIHEPPHTPLNIEPHKPQYRKRKYTGIVSACSTLGDEHDTENHSEIRPKKRRSQGEVPVSKVGGQETPPKDNTVAKSQSGSDHDIKKDTKTSMRVQSASAQTQVMDPGDCGSNKGIEGDRFKLRRNKVRVPAVAPRPEGHRKHKATEVKPPKSTSKPSEVMLLAERERETASSRVEFKGISAAGSQGNDIEATQRRADKKRQGAEVHYARPGIEVRALTARKGSVSTGNASETRDSKEALYVPVSFPSPSECQHPGPPHARSTAFATMRELKRREIPLSTFCTCRNLPAYFSDDVSRFPDVKHFPGREFDFFVHVGHIRDCSGHPDAVRDHCRRIWKEEYQRPNVSIPRHHVIGLAHGSLVQVSTSSAAAVDNKQRGDSSRRGCGR